MRRASIAMVAFSMGLMLPAFWASVFKIGGLVGLLAGVVVAVYVVILLGRASSGYH